MQRKVNPLSNTPAQSDQSLCSGTGCGSCSALDCRLAADLDAIRDPAVHFGRSDRLGDELDRLQRLQHHALTQPQAWQHIAADDRGPLGLWLFGIALGVAAMGQGDAARALLAALPLVDGGADGREALLGDLLPVRSTVAASPPCMAA